MPRLDISKCIDRPGSPGNQTDTRILPLAAAGRPCKAQCSLVTEHKAAGLNLQRVGKRRYCPYVRGPVVICRPHAGWATLIRRRCPETIAPFPASRERQETRSEEHTSELQSLMRISYAVVCLKKKIYNSIIKA